MTVARALSEAVGEEMWRGELVFCPGKDIGIAGGLGGTFAVTLGPSDEFGHECILDTAPSKIGIAGVAAGAVAGAAMHDRVDEAFVQLSKHE